MSKRIAREKVVVLAPRPDDEAFGCSATLAQMAAAGTEINVVILTGGVLRHEWSDLDSHLAEQKRQAKAEQRRQKPIQTSDILGCPTPIFVGWQDGELLQNAHLSDELTAHFILKSPDLILAPSISGMYRDHRAVAQAALSLLAGLGDYCQLAF